MEAFRREFLKLAGYGVAGGLLLAPGAHAKSAPKPSAGPETVFNVRRYGAKGDGKTIDSAAINRAIEAAAASGGGTVLFPAGVYASYSIRLKSFVVLYIEEGATILAADTPFEGMTSGGYDAAESNAPWEAYQDYGHNHWHNSLIWGENIHDFAIIGPGLIWGKGLSRGHPRYQDKPQAEMPGVGNKAIALKNCHNVILRDFSILEGGHFGILATGVDTFTIDNLKIDTNRDGMDIDCCRNVRVSNCSVNSPWDDGICPKSSFALGYARVTENVTISNCYVTGYYQVGTMLDGTFKPFPRAFAKDPEAWTGRIKCGTESNGGFKNIAISNCVFENCRGFALETVDGAILEDITFTGVTMRGITNSPFFFRLGARMRGPKDAAVGTFRRVLVNNVTCYAPEQPMASIIAGIPGHLIEDIKFSNLYVVQKGSGSSDMAAIEPPELETGYPEPKNFGPLPALGFVMRQVREAELDHIEIENAETDARPAFWLNDVHDIDLARITLSGKRGGPAFALSNVTDFRLTGSRRLKDTTIAQADKQAF